MNTLPTIETERLTLRTFISTDALRVSKLAGDERIASVTLNIPHPYSLTDAQQWISELEEKMLRGSLLTYAVTLKNTHQLIGCVTVKNISKNCEVGYWIGIDYWGNGYATEACKALLCFADETRKITHYKAHHLATNKASGRVLLKLGFTQTGTGEASCGYKKQTQAIAFYERHRFAQRIATDEDKAAIIHLMQLSIAENMKDFLSDDEIIAAQETMGVDKTLLEDGTYFVIEGTKNNEKVMVGCGGWGKRKTLYGGDYTKGRDDRLSDPVTEPARIRAMYTHPDWVRQGIGSLLLTLGENAARDAGFKSIELGSTVPGEPLYVAKGYREVEKITTIADNGSENVIIKMMKDL